MLLINKLENSLKITWSTLLLLLLLLTAHGTHTAITGVQSAATTV